MPRNVYFSQGNLAEQFMMEDIMVEALKMYGQETYYLPRKIVTKDKLLNEDVESQFDDAYMIEMYPEDIPFQPADGGAPLSLGYRFPDRFEVEMTYDGQTVGPKIAPAYMDSFTTNFNSSSQAFFTGNNGKAYFSEIDINFTLTESKALNRKSIKEGY